MVKRKNKNATKRLILRIAYEYMMADEKAQPYKLQSMINKKYFSKRRFKMTRQMVTFYTGTFSRMQIPYCLNVRDFIYKHDYFTPRKSYLIHPDMYLYYTYQVFSLCYKLKAILNYAYSNVNFSMEHVNVYYSGTLLFNGSYRTIRKNYNYRSSYSKFQKKRGEYRGNRVLKIDIQDFFNNINLEKLHNDLRLMNPKGHNDVAGEIYSIFQFFKYSKFVALPQIMDCMASSILSQFYLIGFTSRLNKISREKKLDVSRYVDDMYIKLPSHFADRDVNDLANQISTELWKSNLNLNVNKIKVYSVQKYKVATDYSLSKGDSYSNKFIGPEYISDKAKDVLENNGEKLRTFWKDVHNLHSKKGIDLNRYGKLVDKCFGINGEDANKVINSMKFSKEHSWKTLLDSNAMSELLSTPEIIQYDPAMFVTFLIQLEDEYVHETGTFPNIKIEDYLHNLHLSNDDYSIREGLLDSNYFMQRKKFLDNSDNSIQKLNNEYIKFLKRFF